jgi:hypothetical protein
VHNTVKLVSLDDLRIQISHHSLAAIASVGISQSLPSARLAGTWGSHHENAMTDLKQFGKLDDLEDEIFV